MAPASVGARICGHHSQRYATITLQFATRNIGDHPPDMVFTVEYSVRGAMVTVDALMGMRKEDFQPDVNRGDRNPAVLAKALKAVVMNGVTIINRRNILLRI